jgi:hypothetical protein
MMHPTPFQRLLFVTLGLAGAGTCCAEDTPEVLLSAAYAVENGTNLSNVNAVQLVAANNTHHLETSTIGASIRTQQGMQRFQLDGNLVNRSFQSTQTTNTLTSNFDLLWLWSITPRLTGELGADRHEPFDTLLSSSNGAQATSVLNTSSHLDMAWEVDGPWRLLAGLATARTTTTSNAPNDQSSRSANAGVRYISGSGSSWSAKAVATDGEFSATSTNAGLGFQERNVDLRTHWVIDGGTSTDAYLTSVNNSQNASATSGARSFSGLNAGGSLTWSVTGASLLQLDIAHTLAATGFSSPGPNFSETDSISIGPVWQASAKTSFSLHHTWAQQTFRGYLDATPPRQDIVRATGLSAKWQPYPHFSLSAGLQRVMRDSNDLNAEIASNSANVSAQITF